MDYRRTNTRIIERAKGGNMTNAEIEYEAMKLQKEADTLAERDRLKAKNNADLKRAWKRFLKGKKNEK